MMCDSDNDVSSLYRVLTTEELERIRWALQLDRVHAKGKDATGFCDRRIAMIDQELTARNTTVRI